MSLVAVQALSPAWNPLIRQEIEPDTTFLFDPDADTAAGFIPGYSGLISSANAPSIVQGKFRKGIQPQTTGTVSHLWCLHDGMLPPDEFTIDWWVKASTDWTQVPQRQPFFTIGGPNNYLLSQIVSGGIQVFATHAQNPASLPTYTAQSLVPLTLGQLAANTWQNVALTLLNGQIYFWLNGVQQQYSIGGNLFPSLPFVPPHRWGTGQSGGLYLCSDGGTSATALTLSDFRISRRARVPNVERIVLTGRSTVQVGAATGSTVAPLNGLLHALAENGSSGDKHNPPSGGDAYQTTAKAFALVRTAKFEVVTPIKAGAVDATHPTLGHSGAWSYDWQVVDRSAGYIVNTLKCGIYLSFASIPQILGGTGSSPYSGTQLTSGYAYQASDSAGGPLPTGQNGNYATICADIAYHLVTELGYPVKLIGLWNEPNGGPGWEGGANAIPDWMTLYAAVMPAVRAAVPGVKLGGPDALGFSAPWVQGLIAYAGAHSVPLDFVSWHYYSGDISELEQARLQVAAWAQAAGITTPELVLGEGSWTYGNLGIWPWLQPPSAGGDPGPDRVPTNYSYNDFEAAFMAASLVEMQAAGVTHAIFDIFDPITQVSDLITTAGVPWATFNTFRLWSMMVGNTVLSTTIDADPGVWAVASKNNTTGKTYVFIASVHYRETQNYPTLVDLTGTGIADGTAVTVTLIDDAHSNQWDAGLANAGLQTVSTTQPAGVVKGGKVGVVLRPRAVALAVIG